MRLLWILVIVGMGLVLFSTMPDVAQLQEPPTGPEVLVSGVDVNGEGFPLVVIDLGNGSARTLATFAQRPACTPTVFPEGERLWYELTGANLYQVHIPSGERTVLSAEEARLTCPTIAPDGSMIAWVRQHEVEADLESPPQQVELVLTDPTMTEVHEMAVHPYIYDVRWSPGSGAFVYHVTSDAVPFPSLYSLPRGGGVEPRLVWGPERGILHDYRWVSDSTGLLVAYYTDAFLGVALLPTDCVIGPGDSCAVEPVAMFDIEDSLTLLNAYSPATRQAIVSLQEGRSGRHTDLWRLDLSGEALPQQMTHTPRLVETDAYWSMGSDIIYFIGSQIDAETQTLRGRVYRMPADTSGTPEAVYESHIFSPAAFLWWYDK